MYSQIYLKGHLYNNKSLSTKSSIIFAVNKQCIQFYPVCKGQLLTKATFSCPLRFAFTYKFDFIINFKRHERIKKKEKKQDAYYTKFTFNNFCYRYENVYIFSIMLILVFLCKTSSTLILLQKFHILFYILSEFHIFHKTNIEFTYTCYHKVAYVPVKISFINILI